MTGRLLIAFLIIRITPLQLMGQEDGDAGLMKDGPWTSQIGEATVENLIYPEILPKAWKLQRL